MQNLTSPDRNSLADFVEGWMVGATQIYEWRHFIINHYLDEEMEHLRAECVRVAHKMHDTTTKIESSDISNLKALIAKLRA